MIIIKRKFVSILISLLVSAPLPAQAAIIFDGADTGGVTLDDSYVIDYDQSSEGNRDLQFGGSSTYIRWDGTQFQLSNDLNLNSNQVKAVRFENVTTLPGGSGGLGVAGRGRIVQLSATDSIAPGCGGPSCNAGTYSWDGNIWHALQGSVTAANATRIVTVGPTGRDYTTVAAAASYLNSLSGGEIWIDPGTYPVTTSVDLENTVLRGAGGNGITIISLSGSGQLLVKDTFFEELNINVGSITTATGLNIKYSASSSSSLTFTKVYFAIIAGKFAVGSTAATAPTTLVNLQNCSEVASDPGSFINTVASAGLNTETSSITVINQLTTNPLKISNWPVTIIGGSNVITSGTITAVPDRTILVSPGMNIQGAIDSLGAQGGVIKLLIGTHVIHNSISLTNNNVQLTGEGPGTILSAPAIGWTGGTTIDDAVVQVGSSNGTLPRSNIIINNFQIQVGLNIHGIQINGGSEVKVTDMTISSIGPKTTGRVGILFTDGATTPASRFTVTRSIVTTDIAANRWVDGVHMDGDASYTGTYGYGNGITDSIMSELIVNEAAETSFVFANVSASAIFSNRARNMGYNSGAIALFIQNSSDIIIINNTVEGNNSATGSGFMLNNNVNDAIIVGNTIRGGPQSFTSGIRINNANCNRNIIDNNIIATATTKISNSGTSTKMESNHIQTTTDPTVSDDNTKGYLAGSLWFNSTNQKVWALQNSTTGAAVWVDLTAVGSGHTQNTDTGTTANSYVLDNDNTGGDIALQFGNTLNERLRWDSTNARFNLTDDMYLGGTLGILEGGTTPTFYTIFQGADQTGNILYTLPAGQGAADTRLSNDGTGVLTWKGNLNALFTFLADANNLTWNNQPAALTELTGSNRRIRVDLTNATSARLSVNVSNAGTPAAVLALQYSTNQTTWNYLDGANGPTASVGATGLQVGAFSNLAAGARADVFLRVVGRSGNNNSDPAFSKIQLEVK